MTLRSVPDAGVTRPPPQRSVLGVLASWQVKQGRSLFAEEAHGCTTSTALTPSEPLSTASSHGNEGPRSRHGEAAGREGAAQQVDTCCFFLFKI